MTGNQQHEPPGGAETVEDREAVSGRGPGMWVRVYTINPQTKERCPVTDREFFPSPPPLGADVLPDYPHFPACTCPLCGGVTSAPPDTP